MPDRHDDDGTRVVQKLDAFGQVAILEAVGNLRREMDRRFDDLREDRRHRDEAVDKRFTELTTRVQALYDKFNVGKGAALLIGSILGGFGIMIAIWDRIRGSVPH